MTLCDARVRLAALVAILVLAFALRMVRVGELRMWGDEAYSVYSANRSLAAITFEGAENDPHPPLYYYLLHFYMPLAGASELALRLFSVLPGVATIALIYLTGKRLFGVHTGLLAAVFAAIAPFDVYYSQEIRMYALAIFLTALGLYCFVRLFSGSSNKRWWLAYAVTMGLALYALYHTAFVFLAEGVFLLAFVRTRRELVVRWFAVSTGIVLAFLPWLAFRFSSTLGHLEDRAGRTAQSLPVFVARGFAALMAGTTIPVNTALVLAIVFFALIITGIIVVALKRVWTWREWLILALAVVPIIAVYPLYLLLPILVARLFALAFVPLVLLVARSLTQVYKPIGFVFAVAIIAISGYSLSDYYFHFDRYNAAAEDYIPVIRSVEAAAQPGDVVLFHAYWQMGYFLSHYHGPTVQYRLLDRAEDLVAAVAQPRNIWVVVQELSLHGSEVWLTQHAYPMGEHQFGLMRLSAFRSETPSMGERFPSPVLFANGMALRGYRISGEPLEAGRAPALVELDWQADGRIAEDYTVSVRLSSEDGTSVWAQEDSQPAGGTRRTSEWQPNEAIEDRHALTIPGGIPPGNYAIQVVVYDAGTGRAINVVAPENRRGQSFMTAPLVVSRPTGPVAYSPAANSFAAEWPNIALIGFDVGATELMQGDTLPLTLYWQTRSKPARDYLVHLLVVDAEGGWRAASTARPAGDAFPTPLWSNGEVWMQKLQLTLDAASVPGPATVVVFLSDSAADETLPVQTDVPTRELTIKGMVSPLNLAVHAVPLTTVSISGRTRHYDLPPVQYGMPVGFGPIRLLGYRAEPESLKAGDTLKLELYWQPAERMDRRYTMFVHLLALSGELVAQSDSEPDNGGAPTTSWLPSEVISDSHDIVIPATVAPGEYTLEIGVYDRESGRRLPVGGANPVNPDAFPLQKISVRAP